MYGYINKEKNYEIKGCIHGYGLKDLRMDWKIKNGIKYK